MPQANVTMNVHHANSQASVIQINGEINAFAESILMDAYTKASGNNVHTIILNFKELEYMNSSGIGLLVTLLIRVQRQKQKLMAVGLNSHYQQIFELTRLNEAIAIYDSEAEALAAAV